VLVPPVFTGTLVGVSAITHPPLICHPVELGAQERLPASNYLLQMTNKNPLVSATTARAAGGHTL
jgi:hypothetical protein